MAQQCLPIWTCKAPDLVLASLGLQGEHSIELQLALPGSLLPSGERPMVVVSPCLLPPDILFFF